ncbi:hypothetical protein PO403_21355, partial [Escherichia coli]
DRNRSHWSTSKTPSYTKSVSWQHHQEIVKKFHMYHRVAIEYSGGIYDIDNLRRAHLICMMKFITGDS